MKQLQIRVSEGFYFIASLDYVNIISFYENQEELILN